MHDSDQSYRKAQILAPDTPTERGAAIESEQDE
jgi:hypothetical protein